MPGWPDGFAPFTLAHLATALACLAASISVVACGRRWRGRPGEARLRLGLGWGLLALEVVYQLHDNLPSRFDPAWTLPLHACDLTAWFAVAALLTRRRAACAILYFVGLGLSTQTFFTPTLDEGPVHARFWLFWGSHTLIVTAALWMPAVEGFFPGRRDLRLATLATLVYAILITPVNLALQANYGYLGRQLPETPTLLDALGPWPLRAFAVLGLALALFFLMWWVPARLRGRKSA